MYEITRVIPLHCLWVLSAYDKVTQGWESGQMESLPAVIQIILINLHYETKYKVTDINTASLKLQYDKTITNINLNILLKSNL